jgi:hypothetical protein
MSSALTYLYAFATTASTPFLLPQIRLLRYFDDDDEIDAASAFNHPGEVVTLSASSANPDLLATVGNLAGKRRGTVWRMPAVPSSSESNRGGAMGPAAVEMTRVCDIPSSSLQHLQWFPTSDAAGQAHSGQLLAVEDGSAKVGMQS